MKTKQWYANSFYTRGYCTKAEQNYSVVIVFSYQMQVLLRFSIPLVPSIISPQAVLAVPSSHFASYDNSPGGVGHDACVTCKHIMKIVQVLKIFHVSK